MKSWKGGLFPHECLNHLLQSVTKNFPMTHTHTPQEDTLNSIFSEKSFFSCLHSFSCKILMDYLSGAGVTPAEKLLELYHGKWGECVDPVFEELLY